MRRPRIGGLHDSLSMYGGVKAFVRRIPPGITVTSEEEGKFIFPPGGLFLLFLSNPEMPQYQASGRIAFGWWEENIHPYEETMNESKKAEV